MSHVSICCCFFKWKQMLSLSFWNSSAVEKDSDFRKPGTIRCLKNNLRCSLLEVTVMSQSLVDKFYLKNLNNRVLWWKCLKLDIIVPHFNTSTLKEISVFDSVSKIPVVKIFLLPYLQDPISKGELFAWASVETNDPMWKAFRHARCVHPAVSSLAVTHVSWSVRIHVWLVRITVGWGIKTNLLGSGL